MPVLRIISKTDLYAAVGKRQFKINLQVVKKTFFQKKEISISIVNNFSRQFIYKLDKKLVIRFTSAI